MDEMEARESLCRVGQRLSQRGLVTAGEGNFCIRLDDGDLLMTPAGAAKGDLKPEDMVRLAPNGEVKEGGVPSSEVRLHLRAMSHRPDCRATIHAHPPLATAFGVAGRTIPQDVLPEACVMLGPVALCPFGMPGTNRLPDSISPFLSDHKTFLLSQHGAFVLGKDIQDACFRMETLEQVAKIIITAEQLGRVNRLPEGDQRELASFCHGRLG